MTPEEFRSLFPALRSTTWLDTPGSPPCAAPVSDALRDAVSSWCSGNFDWQTWDSTVDQARILFADLVGVEPATVSVMSSLAEAAATVAGSLPSGRIVVPAEEFRSNLFPWLARHEVVAVPARNGSTQVEDLISAIDERTVLLAVSEVTSREGQRLDLAALRAATDHVGARLFVNLTQSLGALRFDAALRCDYVAVHGYKWMLSPRGAAWLVSRPDRLDELTPLAPNWKSTDPPHRYFGGPMRLPENARRCDTSPAWLSWIGACAALRLLAKLDPHRVEQHCLTLAGRLTETARKMGLRRVTTGTQSQITVLRTNQANRIADEMRSHNVRVTALGDRLRIGFHYFNNNHDLQTVMHILNKAQS